MHETTYDSVGTLTFCFDTTAYTGSAAVTFKVRQGDNASSPAERSSRVPAAPEDPTGLLHLNVRENQRIASAIDECIRSDTAFRIKGNFKNLRSGAVTPWIITLSATRVENVSDSDTQQFTFYSGFSSEYPAVVVGRD